MSWHEYIHGDPSVLAGKPVIRGTRGVPAGSAVRGMDRTADSGKLSATFSGSAESAVRFRRGVQVRSPYWPSSNGLKLLANENVPLASVRALRDLGQDVASISEDSPGVSDEEVVRRARAENRTIVTFDRDYGRLAFHRGVFPPVGVLYLRFSPNEPTEAAGFAARLMADGVELQGRFTTADRVRIRQRILRSERN